MKSIILSIFIISNFLFFFAEAQQVEKKEIQKEIKRLERLKQEVSKLIQENKKLLAEIKKNREELAKERKAFEDFKKQAEEERYKKLAKVFEKMESELAGEKISKMDDPKKAAFILYNIKARKAGDILNYVDPSMVSKIVKILTDLKSYKSAKK